MHEPNGMRISEIPEIWQYLFSNFRERRWWFASRIDTILICKCKKRRFEYA